MATLEQLESALRNADRAGDVNAARALANELKRMRGVSPAAEPAAAAPGVTAATAAPEPEDPIVKRGTFIPAGRTESGELVPAVPEFLMGPMQTISDLLEGKRQATDISGKEVFELGVLLGGRPAAAGTGREIAAARGGAKVGSPVTEAGKRVGVDVPRAVGSETSTVQQAGKIVQAVPGGGQPMRKASERAITQLGEAATRVEEGFGGGSVPRAATAVEQGVTAFGGPQGVLAQRAAARLDKVDALISPNTTHQLSETASTASTILARRKEAAITDKSQAVRLIEQATTRPGGLSYQGIKTLRTYIGELIGKPGMLPSDISGAELKQIYKSLTTDLRAAVQAGGGETAVRAFDVANRSFQKTMEIRENLSRILKTDNEGAIFSKIEGMAGSTSRADLKTLAQTRAAVGKEGWGEVASAMISRIGRDPEGNFSPQRFLTGWGKLSANGKKILFETTGQKGLARALDDIAKVSSRFKELQKFANPSGSGQTIVGAGIGTASAGSLITAFIDPLTAATTALSVGTTVGGARILSNILAKPQTAAPFATWAKAYGAFVGKPSNATAQAFRASARALVSALVEQGDIPKEERERIQTELGRITPGGA